MRVRPAAAAGRNAPAVAAALLATSVGAGIVAQDANATSKEKPFKVAKFYFETNASACEMGIQIVFDTDGIASGQFEDPHDRVVHQVRVRNGLLRIGGQTEGFLESVEPVIAELVEANRDCEPDPKEPTVTLARFRALFPAGTDDFEGVAPDGTVFDDEDELTYCIPAAPECVRSRPDRINPIWVILTSTSVAAAELSQ
jgi:hypothetical protein